MAEDPTLLPATDMSILVCKDGFIYIGQIHKDEREYLFYKLTRCGVIRRWGTTKGLGQLALEGVQTGTTIDREPDGTIVQVLDIKRIIPCVHESWNTWALNGKDTNPQPDVEVEA